MDDWAVGGSNERGTGGGFRVDPEGVDDPNNDQRHEVNNRSMQAYDRHVFPMMAGGGTVQNGEGSMKMSTLMTQANVLIDTATKPGTLYPAIQFSPFTDQTPIEKNQKLNPCTAFRSMYHLLARLQPPLHFPFPLRTASCLRSPKLSTVLLFPSPFLPRSCPISYFWWVEEGQVKTYTMYILRLSVSVFRAFAWIFFLLLLTLSFLQKGISTDGKESAYKNIGAFCSQGGEEATAMIIRDQLKAGDLNAIMRTLDCLEEVTR